MDATAILDYFAPLKKWLDEQNRGKACGLVEYDDDERCGNVPHLRRLRLEDHRTRRNFGRREVPVR